MAASVDEQGVAGEVTGVVAGEEDRDRRDVGLGIAQTAHWIGGVGQDLELGVRREHGSRRRRLGARADCIGDDSVGRPLPRGRAGERAQCFLGAVVVRRSRRGRSRR